MVPISRIVKQIKAIEPRAERFKKVWNTKRVKSSVTLSTLCVTRWTVRATKYMKVLSNYDSLMQLWDISMQDALDGETRPRIIGCEARMKSFELFYGLNLGNALYNMADNLSKTIQKENCSAIDGQKSATLQALEGMETTETVKSFHEAIIKKASKHPFIKSPILHRKRKMPKYKSMQIVFR